MVGKSVGTKLGIGEGTVVWVGASVGNKSTTFITVMVADIYGLQMFTAEEVSNVTVRDDEEVT